MLPYIGKSQSVDIVIVEQPVRLNYPLSRILGLNHD